jgi:hypothetical protein
VLIVDEVDDLIVNEKPVAHYVKEDVKRTPAVKVAYTALKEQQPRPEGVDEGTWRDATQAFAMAAAMKEGEHYRVVTAQDGQVKVIILDAQGRIPKVPLVAPWQTALEYTLGGVEPTASSGFACTCTPYIFNK